MIKKLPLSAFVFVFSLLYLFIGCHYLINTWEDGAANFAAQRVLAGDIPYRDFMLITTPAHPYMLAFFFKIFGASLIVERFWHCLVWSLAFVLVYLINRSFSTKFFAVLGWLIGLAWLGRFFHIPGPMPSAVLFSLGAIYSWLKAGEQARTSLLWLSGLAIGISILFRQDIGLYTLLGLSFASWAAPTGGFSRQEIYPRLLAGVLCVAAAPAAYFLFQTPFKELFFDLVWYPVKIYPSYSRIPWPADLHENTFIFYFSWLMPILGMGLVCFRLYKEKARKTAAAAGFVAMASCGALFLNLARLRPDVAHLIPATIVSCSLFSFLMEKLFKAGHRFLASFLMILVALSCVPAVQLKARLIFSPPEPFFLELDRAGRIGLLPKNEAEVLLHRNYEKTVKYVREHTKPGEKIFVGNIRHDQVCYGDPLFYFLSFTGSATRYHEMYRGTVTTEAVQNRMVSEFERQKVRTVVLRPFLDFQCGESNASSDTTGAHILDDYLRAHFAIERKFGDELVLTRVS